MLDEIKAIEENGT
jgi:hypothetical protein